MTRTPGTNIFSHAIEVTALPDAELQFAYYMHLSEASLAAVAERFNAYDSEGNPAVVDWIDGTLLKIMETEISCSAKMMEQV